MITYKKIVKESRRNDKMFEAEKLDLSNSLKELEHGRKCTPGGVLGIRRPYNFVEGEYPIYFDHGKGGKIVDVDNNEFIDYLCAYGPIILGHREEEVDKAVIDQIQNKGFCFSLTQEIQNRLADKLRSLIPCAQMSVFTKTGSDATTLAVRIARGHTGKNKIIRCGYHGWHDWCVEVKGGIPEKLYEDVLECHYNDINSLKALLEENSDDTAAIIITPLGHPLGAQCEYPKDGYLQEVRKLADQYNAVLIFDEIRTGFRVGLSGIQGLYNVVPDLSTFGKAMANGYAISACVGKTEVMKVAEKDVFVSSTFFPNSLAIVAALKTIEILERDNVLEKIKQKGEYFNAGLNKILQKHETDTSASPVPQMPFVVFNKDSKKTYKAKRIDFYTQLIRRKVFLQPFHHGYICYRHTTEEIDYTLDAIDKALSYIDQKNY